MNYDFVQTIMEKGLEAGKGGEEPTTSFKVGFAVGATIVTLIGIAAEAALVLFAASLLGFTLTYVQGIVIALTFEYILARQAVS
tara:strand:+ start:22 stop:273 length:252 start_codon:yes stop_codon:yes gene_type:complete